jgi:hypothetical protein
MEAAPGVDTRQEQPGACPGPSEHGEKAGKIGRGQPRGSGQKVLKAPNHSDTCYPIPVRRPASGRERVLPRDRVRLAAATRGSGPGCIPRQGRPGRAEEECRRWLDLHRLGDPPGTAQALQHHGEGDPRLESGESGAEAEVDPCRKPR